MMILAVCSFGGCFEDKDSDVLSGNVDNLEEVSILYDNAQNFMNTEFLKSNITKGATFGALDSKEYASAKDDDLPEKIEYVVKKPQQFEETFASFPVEIDFSKEMLIVLIFIDYQAGTPIVLERAKLENGELQLHIPYDYSQYDDVVEGEYCPPPVGSAPVHRSIAVKVPKMKFSSIKWTS